MAAGGHVFEDGVNAVIREPAECFGAGMGRDGVGPDGAEFVGGGRLLPEDFGGLGVALIQFGARRRRGRAWWRG